MLETLKAVAFEYVVHEYKFPGDTIFILLNNFEKIIKLAFFFLKLMERECFLILNKQISAYTRNRKGKLSNYLENLFSEDCLKTLPSPMSRFLKILF